MGTGSRWILWTLLFVAIAALFLHRSTPHHMEAFVGDMGVDLMKTSTRAMDSAPTTSEVKQHYKKLLLFVNDNVAKNGADGLRIMADLRDRLFGKRNFKSSLYVNRTLIDKWPTWLPPLDTSIQEPIPSADEAVEAELRILAYLQKNFPQESEVNEETGSTLRNLTEDFGRRFVFEEGVPVKFREDFLREPLIKGWVSPLGRD